VNVGSLFSGIGGFDLGLERAGMRTVWFCEQDDYCRRVLARHWPGVPCHPDVRALVANAEGSGGRARGSQQSAPGLPDGVSGAGEWGLPVPVPYVDVLAGGFPCQDLSVAGKGAGIDGARSGLWSEFSRLVGELRPRYVIVENVPALLVRGGTRVIGDLAALRYDCEWACIPASAFGAPHRRDRVWIVAYPAQLHGYGSGNHPRSDSEGAYALSESRNGSGNADLADADSAARGQSGRAGEALSQPGTLERSGRCGSGIGNPWESEPDVGRVAHGIPHRVDRLRALGNALVPQIAEWIGRRIVSYEQ
jgi:DNA (cytosine-5)-methyltransferase 1